MKFENGDRIIYLHNLGPNTEIRSAPVIQNTNGDDGDYHVVVLDRGLTFYVYVKQVMGYDPCV